MASPSTTTSHPASQERWLFGPIPDLLLGCGVGYAIILTAVISVGNDLQTWVPAGVLVMVVTLANTPHYGATLMRVYEQRENRRRFAVFSVWITAGLALAFVVACYWHDLGSWLLTIYLNWSPWHYAGQNYGIALMFLHRRGVPVSAEAKRFLHASFVLAFLLTFTKVNGQSNNVAYGVEGASSSGEAAERAFRFISVGIPEHIQQILLIGAFAAYLLTTAIAFRRLASGSSRGDLLPSALIVASHSLWFVVPVAFQSLGVLGDSIAFSKTHIQYSFMFIAASHSVQYLWITTYYARHEPTYRTTSGYLLQAMFAGSIVWTLPSLVFVPGVLGTVSYNGGLIYLIAAVVNLHHFVLDGAVWKLRDGRVARVLLRDVNEEDRMQLERPRRRWVRPLILGVGLTCCVVAYTARWDMEFEVRRATPTSSVERLRAAVTRLAWIGRDHPSSRRRLGVIAAQQGDDELALQQLRKSLEMKAHPRAWFEIGHIHSNRGEWVEATEAYEAAYELDPHPKKLIGRLALALIRTGDAERANEILRRGLHEHPEAVGLRKLLKQAERLESGARQRDPVEEMKPQP